MHAVRGERRPRPVAEIPLRKRDPERARHVPRRHVDPDGTAVAGADSPQRATVLREQHRPRRRGAVVARARQVDAARLGSLQVELVHHRAAVLADVEREQEAAVHRGEALERLAPDRAGLVRILERRRIEPAGTDVRQQHLVAAAAEVLDQEEVVAEQRVEVPVAAIDPNYLLRLPRRHDTELRTGVAPPHDGPRPVLRDADECPTLCQLGTGDFGALGRVPPGQRVGVLVYQEVAAGEAPRHGPARLARRQIGDRDRRLRLRAVAEQ